MVPSARNTSGPNNIANEPSLRGSRRRPVKGALLRHDLLDIAARYDHLAERVERWGSDDGA
jgi:hypothetical protein